MKEDTQISFTQEEKELVIFRIETAPSNLRLSIGGGQSMSKKTMIQHIRKGDNIGKQIINLI